MKTCRDCGMQFEGKRREFCSARCMKNWHSKHQGYVKSSVTETVPCVVCGKLYTRKRSRGKYCSQKCKDKAHQAMRRQGTREVTCSVCRRVFQTNYPTQHLCADCGSYEDRGPTRVHPRIRQTVLEAQKNLCWLCRGPLDFTEAVVHHLDVSGNAAEPNNEPGNIVALHKKCHAMFHRPHIVFRNGVWGIGGRIFEYLDAKVLKVMAIQYDKPKEVSDGC